MMAKVRRKEASAAGEWDDMAAAGNGAGWLCHAGRPIRRKLRDALGAAATRLSGLMPPATAPARADVLERLSALDWDALAAELDAHGAAVIPKLLSPEACAGLIETYAEPERFRSKVVMARHGYGQGEYQYLAYPLPVPVETLRTGLYPPLAGIANRWAEALGEPRRYPADHRAYLEACHAAGQIRPTPLLLKYVPGDYNRLHQDLYGELVFPLQLTVLLSRPGEDFTGGEFVLTEQRPRMQSRAEVVALGQGDAVVFPVRHRPGAGPRGAFRLTMRHGVSRLRSGERYTLGIIFHDAA
jgi:hypothetical protein